MGFGSSCDFLIITNWWLSVYDKGTKQILRIFFYSVLKLVLRDTDNILDVSGCLKQHMNVLMLFLRVCSLNDTQQDTSRPVRADLGGGWVGFICL